MYKKAWCTCGVVVLLIKPIIIFWHSRCRRRRGFVRSLLYNIYITSACLLTWYNYFDNFARRVKRFLGLNPLVCFSADFFLSIEAVLSQLDGFTLWHNGRRAKQPGFIDACTRCRTLMINFSTNHAEKYEGLIQSRILPRVLNALEDSPNADR